MSKITLHAQGWEGWLNDFAAVSGARWMKFVNWFPVMGDVSLIGRVHVPEADQDAMIAAGATGADAFFNRVYPEMVKARHVALWEGPNEPSIWKGNVLAGFHAFYQRLIKRYHENDFRICAGSINTGWPYLPSDDGGTQSAVVGRALQGADAVGFHEYDPKDLRNWGYTAGRYRKTVAYWRSLGLSVPDVFITELGLDAPGGPCFGHWGWRGILKNNLAAYIEQLKWYEARIQEDEYVKAATIFSVITNWTEFMLDQGQAMEVARALASGGPEPPEPPGPGGPMETKYYDGQGNQRDEVWLRANWGQVQVTADNAAYSLCELHESLNGSSALVVSLRGKAGQPLEGKPVAFGWPDGEVQGTTNENGDVGFGMGGGAYYQLPGPGPHYVKTGGVTVTGLGMKWGTNHDHLNVLLREGDEPEPPVTDWATGVDVSHYQGDIDWDAVKAAGVSFAFIRASAGLEADAKFARNWEEAGKRGILRGAYHYLRQEDAGQAKFFLDCIGGRFLELGCWADIEQAGLTAAKCEQFLVALDGLSTSTTNIYTRASFFDAYGTPTWAATRELWVASPGKAEPVLPKAWAAWEFWQYSQGTIDGRTVDLDRYNGTVEDLHAVYGWVEPPDDVEKLITEAQEKIDQSQVLLDEALVLLDEALELLP